MSPTTSQDDDRIDLTGAALPHRRDVDEVAATARRSSGRRRAATVAGTLVAAGGLAVAGVLLLGPPAQNGSVAIEPSPTSSTPAPQATSSAPPTADGPACAEAATAAAVPRAVYLPCDDGASVAAVERPGLTSLADAAQALSTGPQGDETARGWTALGEDAVVTAEQREDRVVVDVTTSSTTSGAQLRAALAATVLAWTGAGKDAVVFTANGSCGEWESLTGTPCETPAGGAPAAPTGCATAPELPACTPGEGEGG